MPRSTDFFATFVLKKKGDDRKSDKMLTFVLRNIYKKKSDKLFTIFIRCIQRFCDTPQEATSLCQRFVFNNSKKFFSLVLFNMIVVIKVSRTFFSHFFAHIK